MIDLKKIAQYEAEGKLFRAEEAMIVLGGITPTTLKAMVRRGQVKEYVWSKRIRGYKIQVPKGTTHKGDE